MTSLEASDVLKVGDIFIEAGEPADGQVSREQDDAGWTSSVEACDSIYDAYVNHPSTYDFVGFFDDAVEPG